MPQPSAKGERNKKKKSLLSFTKHAHLLVFLFYCISHCYKPDVVYFPPFYDGDIPKPVSTQTMKQTYNMYPKMLAKIPTNGPLRMNPQTLPDHRNPCPFTLQSTSEREVGLQ